MAAAAPEVPILARDQAFERLYRSYVKDVYHYALALLRNPADAEDVTQTTFMNAYRAYKRGETPLKPQNWLIKIAHNVARTRYARASRRVKEVPLEDHVEQLAVPDEEKPDVQAVLDALGRLPLNQRAALVMRELEGRTYAEIADTIGVSVAAVETLIFRGRRSLRLKASSIRALAAIPLPSSLAQLFETGGIVAGGGAIVGSGFLLKAAVAIVAGVVATGIGSEHGRQAQAESTGAVPVVGNAGEQGLRAGSAATTSEGASFAHGPAASVARGPVSTAPAGRFAEVERSHGAGGAATAPSAGPAATATGGPSTGSSPLPSTAPAASAPKPVTDTVSSTTSAVTSAPAPPVPLPSVPSVPTVPTLQVPVPEPPPVPTLP